MRKGSDILYFRRYLVPDKLINPGLSELYLIVNNHECQDYSPLVIRMRHSKNYILTE
jgi:hypothetical protein